MMAQANGGYSEFERSNRRQPVDDNSYFTSTRGWELAKVAAICGTSVAVLAEAGALSAPIPPLTAVLLGTAGLSFAGCIAFSVIVVAAPDDRTLNQLMEANKFFGPGLFLIPVGAILGGEEGMKLAAETGNVLIGGLGIARSLEQYGLSFVLSTDPSKILFLDDFKTLVENPLLNSDVDQPDFGRNYYDPDYDVFEPDDRYDLDTSDPPGMGDMSTPGDPPPDTADA